MNPLTPAREAEIRERVKTMLPNTAGKWPGNAIPALLAALDAERARADAAEKDTTWQDHADNWQKQAVAAEARVRVLEEAMRVVRVELAALVPDPEADAQTWTLAFPDIREPDRKCLQDAYDIARTALESKHV